MVCLSGAPSVSTGLKTVLGLQGGESRCCRFFITSNYALSNSEVSHSSLRKAAAADTCPMFSTPPSSSSSFKVYGHRINALPRGGDFFWENDPTPLLDTIESPLHLKNLSSMELKQLADEIRSEISFMMSKTRKSYKPSLGAVELTIAIHRVFHAPLDKILWDDGEQTLAHKILTGRRSLFHTLKQKDGVSGFTSRFESDYDAFGSGHGCNSVSAGLVPEDMKDD